MSVFKRNGIGNYYIQFNMNGKTFCKSSKTTNKKIAERMEREWRDEIHRIDELGERPKILFKTAIEQYAASKEGTGSYAYAKHNATAISNGMDTSIYADELKDWHIQKFKSKREAEGLAPQTIKHNLQAIRSTMEWAKSHGYATKPIEYPKVKLLKHRLRYLSHLEEKKLLADLDPYRKRPFRPDYENCNSEEKRKYHDNYDLVVLLLDTGARYSEIANLSWKSIDIQQSVIRLWRPKVRNESLMYMTTRVKEILERRFTQKGESDYLFENQDGDARGYQSKGIRAAIKRAGIEDFKIHDLRHTCASRLVQAGLSLYEIANILGHTDISTTQIYAHLERKDVCAKARDILNQINVLQGAQQ